MTDATPTTPAPPLPLHARMAEIQAELRQEAKALTKLAIALGPLTKEKACTDLAKLPALIEKVAAKVAAIPGAAERGDEIVAGFRDAVVARKRLLRERLAAELREACAAKGLELRVVTREEPVEVRIPPLAVVIDRDKGTAELQFAKLALASVAATPDAILTLHESTIETLNRDWDPQRFFSACHRAWLAARGTGVGGAGDRVEILDFLPYLALQLQKPAFHREPTQKNFRDYSRARFAWDLLRLRREGLLTQDGQRLNLGVATGSTASQKRRVVWIEDEHGDGEYKLTVFFTPAGGAT